MPPNRAEAALPTPWATNSILELCRAPIISSATTADSSDSMAASTAMVKASGSTAATVSYDMAGRVSSGRALEIV